MASTLKVESTLTDRQFLNSLAADIATHPERIQVIPSALLARIESLVGRVEVDLDAPLSADDE